MLIPRHLSLLCQWFVVADPRVLYCIQRSVETTCYTVGGNCSFRPADTWFSCPGVFN
jgi:hypothetical protein